MKKILLLGATGSIGESTIKLVKSNPDKFCIVGISAHTKTEQLKKIAHELKIDNLLITSNSFNCPLDKGGKGDFFKDFLNKCEPDIVLNAVGGFPGLKYSFETLENKIPLALANKESLVCGGELLTKLSKETNTPILPVDSEISAIWQCLSTCHSELVSKSLHKIHLTCSGGPFFGKKNLSNVTKDEVLAHPTWTMGKKITVDSATLANKCLELLECMNFFNVKREQINIIIHQQSVVHSMVEFSDSSIIAQMAPPNMELPIAYALNYPKRTDYKLPRQNFSNLNLTFNNPDPETFRTLKIIDICAEKMQNFPIVFNSANEILIAAFLEDKIKFSQIFEYLEKIISETKLCEINSIEKIYEVDSETRKTTLNSLK